MYLGKPSVEDPQKQKFIDMIQRKGWKVINQSFNFPPSWVKSQKEIQDDKFFNILNLVKYYNVKKAIIVSGDAVFVEFLVELKMHCIDIEVWTFRELISRALIEEVGKEHIYFLDDIVEEISLWQIINKEGTNIKKYIFSLITGIVVGLLAGFTTCLPLFL